MRNLLIRRGKLLYEKFTPEGRHYYSATYKLFSKVWTINEWYRKEDNTCHSYIHGSKEALSDYREVKVIKFNHTFKIGNNKLPFAVFNMGSATDCPSLKAGECKIGNKCYALRDEQRYKTPLPYRRRQEMFWRNMSAYDLAEQMKEVMDKKGVKELRMNESGDFRSHEDVEKLNLIAMFLGYYSIKTYTYTSRDIHIDPSDMKHVTIIGSGKAGLDGQFIGVKNATSYAKEARLSGFRSIVCQGSCNICNACLDMKVKPAIIYAEMH